MQGRCTVLDTMVEPKVIENAVRPACRAPSLDNTQPWRWVAGDGSRLTEAAELTESLRRYDSAYHSELGWWTAPFEMSEGLPGIALDGTVGQPRTPRGTHGPHRPTPGPGPVGVAPVLDNVPPPTPRRPLADVLKLTS